MKYGITFGIPAEKICTTLPAKTKLLAGTIPNTTHTYVYETEEDYYAEYQRSYFAVTSKKGGWDCLRHYEILANACVPLFRDIETCPATTMEGFPKELCQRANKLYASWEGKTVDVLTDEDRAEYAALQTELFAYTKAHLTTEAVARRILQVANLESTKRILFLSWDPLPDYLRCLTLHGLKRLLGNQCHEYPKIPHLYHTSGYNYGTLYGKGFTYTNLLSQSLRDASNDSHLLEDIQSKAYDVIVYGSYHRGLPYFDLVRSVYSPSEVILLCGEDAHECDISIHAEHGHPVFVREL
jgi:hypothetical protein